MSTFDFDEVVEHYHRAAGEFVKGNPEAYKMVFSHREDGTWKVVHRHADPITTVQAPASVIHK